MEFFLRREQTSCFLFRRESEIFKKEEKQSNEQDIQTHIIGATY